MNDHVEVLQHQGLILAYIIKAEWTPDKTTFVTPDDIGQQMGMIVYGAGKSIVPHVHLPIMRQVSGTTECIVVRKGSCIIDFYDKEKNYVTSRNLNLGDILLLTDGGHGFRMLEDTVLFEVKQGPYAGDQDKARFTPDQGPAA